MSISSFCIEQREKEQEALKKFLTISLVGSAVFHVVLGFGISWLWAKQPELADEPIEIIVVEEPDTEEKPLTDPPKPEPTPQQPIKTEVPKPPIPQPTIPTVPLTQKAQPAPPASAAPQRAVVQPAPDTPAAPPQPVAPPPPAALAPPTQPTTEPKPVITPSQERTAESSEPAPITPPESVAIDRSAPPRPDRSFQPLQTDSDARQVRERLSEPTQSESTAPLTDDSSDANPASPGAVATNRSAPPRPRGVPGLLSDASTVARQIRERLGGSSSQPTASPGEGDSNANPASPGAVATNRSAPPRPGGTSQALQGSSPDSRQFRESLSGGSSSETASVGGGDSIANPTSAGAVAANRSAPPRPGTGNQGGNTESSRTSGGRGGVSCISGCQPEYPSLLEGKEGSAVVRVVVDQSGNVVDSEIAGGSGNSQIREAAIAAARKMKFTTPEGGSRVAVRVTINFTLAGSDFDRQARERQEQNERERQQRERERQAQLEQERQEQERQAQLERERQEQERQAQLEQERQEQERQAQLEQERQERERQEQERQAQLEQERQERERQEQERQAQLEQERQERERQEQLERERQEQERQERERQEQLERERQEQQEEVPLSVPGE
mgnify:CR=1 FL=1